VPVEQVRQAADRADAAVGGLERAFYATPYRPTGLSTGARVLVRLVDELGWLNAVVLRATGHATRPRSTRPSAAVKSAAAAVLESGADVVEGSSSDPGRCERRSSACAARSSRWSATPPSRCRRSAPAGRDRAQTAAIETSAS